MNASSRLAACRASMSFCGASQASTFPAFISEMRSQRMPSFMKCVVTKIVTPCLRERSIKSSQKLSRATGSTPGGGLVEDQYLGLVQDGDGQREPLPQTHRQILGQRIEMRAEAESFDQLVDARFRLLAAAGDRGGRAGRGSARTLSSP